MKITDMPVCFLFVTEWILWNLHPVLHQLSQVSTVYSTVASDAVCDVEFRRYIELSVVSQFSGGADGVHEEQNFSQVLQRSTGCAEAFAPSGLLPAQAGSENSEISPVVTGTDRTEWSHYCIMANSYFWLSFCECCVRPIRSWTHVLLMFGRNI